MTTKAEKMGMPAVGAYLRTLRDAQVPKLSRAKLAAKLDTHESQLVRIEKGAQDSAGSLIYTLVPLLGGTHEDVERLLDKTATPADGVQAARKRLATPPVSAHIAAVRQKILSLPPDDLEVIGELAERLLREKQAP